MTKKASQSSAPPAFRGSISRRLTILSALFLVLVGLVGGLSVGKARHIAALHNASEELDSHIEVLDRLESSVFHLRAEMQDALFLGEGIDDPALVQLPRQIQELWDRFERMHLEGGRPAGAETVAERALSQEIRGHVEQLLGFMDSTIRERPRGRVALRQVATTLDADARFLGDGLQRLENVHRALILAQTQAAGREMGFILWTYVAFLALGGLAVIAGSVLFVRRMAVPLRRLNAAAAEMARGEFERRVPITSRDDIGMLAHSFNQMAQALSERDVQVKRRTQEAEALQRVGTDISSLLQIDRIITSVVESARGLFRADAAGLALADGAAGEIRWTVFLGDREAAFKEIRLRAGEGLAGRVVASGEPQTVENACSDLAGNPEAHPILAAEGLCAALAVPLRRVDRTLGALMVAYREPRRFAEEEMVLLSSFANQVAVAVENAELYGRVQGLYRVGIEISSTFKLDRILQAIVESARAMLRTDVAGLCLRREGAPSLEMAASAGSWAEIRGPVEDACLGDSAAGYDEVCLRCQGLRSAQGVAQLSVELTLGERVLGALCVGCAIPRTFSGADRNLLGGLATQAAIAIENARLYEAVRGMATLEERERIAREMHDGLAQALGFLSLKLALVERGLDGGEAASLRRELSDMRKVANDAYEEVRQAIFGLRTMVSRGLGLVPTLSEYLHEFSQQAGVQVRLEVPGDQARIRFSPEAEVQLVRIVQEALNNVRKHAGARTARVRLWLEGAEALLAIEDDGAGFDPTQAVTSAGRHFGLATMRERAESVGGTLTIQSDAGRGTRVTLRLPTAKARTGGGR